mgnify:CR=1 FL=1
MTPRRAGAQPRSMRFIMPALALAVVLASMPFAAGEEIPHENYDLAGSDLDTVVALLNASIRSSEGALRGLYDEDLAGADQDLDQVGAVLVPAEDILSDIEDVAGSYDDLSALLPPFVGLYGSMRDFLSQETVALDALAGIASSSDLENLTGEELADALEAIEAFNSAVSRMNDTIDDMLLDAHAIDALTVDGATPFVPNELVELIERLRDKVEEMLLDVQRMIEGDIDWDDETSFVVLWVGDETVYLGDDIVGGGYVLLSGTFVSGQAVVVDMDGDALVGATTGAGGRFTFRSTVPVDGSWLGPHDLTASTEGPNGTVASEPVAIAILLVPTTLTLSADATLLAFDESVNLTAALRDVDGAALPGLGCSLVLDGDAEPFVTDDQGNASWSWTGEGLGYGTHSVEALFPGALPYAPNSSETITIVVDIPTNITLTLFSDRVAPDNYVVGEGLLVANGSDPMPSRQLSLRVDGALIQYVNTTADGAFAFTVDTEGMAKGGHTLRVCFELREQVWRYSEAEVGFVILTRGYMDYPFLPWIPGWDIGFSDIPYLFFGENAYYFWMMALLAVGILVKALQVRKARRAMEGAAEESGENEEAWADEPPKAGPEKAPDWLPGPNEKVVWHYNSLVSFLRRRRRVGIEETMTHWEVATLLRSLGYPEGATRNATLLFERAFYSGATLSEADVILMGSSAHILKRVGGVRPAG